MNGLGAAWTGDGNACTRDACNSNGTCAHANLANGASCFAIRQECCGGVCGPTLMSDRPGSMLTILRRVVHVARSFEEARALDIAQQVAMTPEERQRVARELKERVCGTCCPDVREVHRRP